MGNPRAISFLKRINVSDSDCNRGDYSQDLNVAIYDPFFFDKTYTVEGALKPLSKAFRPKAIAALIEITTLS